jgi:hypothetical protein
MWDNGEWTASRRPARQQQTLVGPLDATVLAE